MMQYNVMQGDRTVGSVEVFDEGLYRSIKSKCWLPRGIYRLFACWQEKEELIGVCYPQADIYVLEKRIPAKRLPLEGIRFRIAEKKVDTHEFILVSEDQPFPALHLLEKASFCRTGDQCGIYIKA